MRKYEELENNVYVKEVGNLITLAEAAKLLGISNKELRSFVISEQMRVNNIVKVMLDKLFGTNIIPEVQQNYYLDLLDNISSIGYYVSVIDNNFPTLKQNPNLLLKAILGYNEDQIKQLDRIKIDNNATNVNPTLVTYVSNFSSDYGISSQKLYDHIISLQNSNKQIFNKLLGTYQKANYGKINEENNVLNSLRKVSNLEYIVASLIYNFPNLASNTDTFFSAIIDSKKGDIEKADLGEINDENILAFINAKKEYSLLEKAK